MHRNHSNPEQHYRQHLSEMKEKVQYQPKQHGNLQEDQWNIDQRNYHVKGKVDHENDQDLNRYTDCSVDNDGMAQDLDNQGQD